MAQASSGAQWQPPIPVAAGPEMAALQPFLFDCRWTGKVRAGGMGPGSPEMQGVGQATFRPIMEGGWLLGDFEQDQFAGRTRVLTWRAHFAIGWDPRAGEYRATYVDNNGSAALMGGRIEGPRLVPETQGEGPVNVRVTWELRGPGRVTWRNESATDGGPWFLVEEYECTPL